MSPKIINNISDIQEFMTLKKNILLLLLFLIKDIMEITLKIYVNI